LYLSQFQPKNDWKAVALFESRAIAPRELSIFQQELMASGRLITIYLDELTDSDSVAIALIRLITSPEKDAPKIVEGLKQQNLDADIIDLVETVLVSKFKKLSREEIEAMFALSDLKNTRVYKDAVQEGLQKGLHRALHKGVRKGLQKGRQEIAVNLLKTGMNVEQVAQVTGLTVEKVRQL